MRGRELDQCRVTNLGLRFLAGTNNRCVYQFRHFPVVVGKEGLEPSDACEVNLGALIKKLRVTEWEG